MKYYLKSLFMDVIQLPNLNVTWNFYLQYTKKLIVKFTQMDD